MQFSLGQNEKGRKEKKEAHLTDASHLLHAKLLEGVSISK